MLSTTTICRIEQAIDSPFDVHDFMINPKEDVALWYDLYHNHFSGNKQEQIQKLRDALVEHAAYKEEAFSSERYTGLHELFALGVYLHCLEKGVNAVEDKAVPEILYQFGKLLDAGSRVSISRIQPCAMLTFANSKQAKSAVVSVTNAKGLIKSSEFYAKLEQTVIEATIRAERVMTELLYLDGNNLQVRLADYRVNSFDGALRHNPTLDSAKLIADCSPATILAMVELFEDVQRIQDPGMVQYLMRENMLYQDLLNFPSMHVFVNEGVNAAASITPERSNQLLSKVLTLALERYPSCLFSART